MAFCTTLSLLLPCQPPHAHADAQGPSTNHQVGVNETQEALSTDVPTPPHAVIKSFRWAGAAPIWLIRRALAGGCSRGARAAPAAATVVRMRGALRSARANESTKPGCCLLHRGLMHVKKNVAYSRVAIPNGCNSECARVVPRSTRGPARRIELDFSCPLLHGRGLTGAKRAEAAAPSSCWALRNRRALANVAGDM
jgi:hypothetical protein